VISDEKCFGEIFISRKRAQFHQQTS
jgi:hypothetical protein